MRVSYSALDTFSTCPAKYKYQYIDRISVPKSKELVFGTLIHECLHMFHQPTRSRPVSEDELLKYFAEKWEAGPYQDEQEESFDFHRGVDLLKRYYLQNQSADFNIVDLETPFEVPFLEKPDQSADGQELHQITGRIDRIDKLPDGTFEIIDYKTSKKMPSQESVDQNFQLSIYYLGITNRWPSLQKENRPVKLSLYYLIHGEKLSTLRTNQQAQESKEKILSLINQIKESDFQPRANPLCGWCPYQPWCPLFKHKYQSPAPDDQKIKEVIDEYFQIKDKQDQGNKRLGQLKEMINQYLDQKGLERLFGQKGQLTRLPQKRFSYNLKKVKEVLEPLGKWNEILTIDSAKFKKVVDSLPYQTKRQIDQAKTLDREFKVISASKKSVKE